MVECSSCSGQVIPTIPPWPALAVRRLPELWQGWGCAHSLGQCPAASGGRSCPEIRAKCPWPSSSCSLTLRSLAPCRAGTCTEQQSPKEMPSSKLAFTGELKQSIAVAKRSCRNPPEKPGSPGRWAEWGWRVLSLDLPALLVRQGVREVP